MKKTIALIGWVLFFAGCTHKMVRPIAKPDEVVKSFISLSASAQKQEDKTELKKMCSGQLENAFERMTDEAFKVLYLGNKLELKSLTITESKVEGDSAKVRYKVIVQNNQGTDPTREENEREVSLVRANANADWKIDQIQMVGSDRIAFTRGMIF